MSKKAKKSQKGTRGHQKTKLTEKHSISLCMIVKDEEKFLDNCLRSIKDVADEIIIIDTGSKDNTVNIAKKYTDKIYFHPWKDSFSEARNHYFEYASGEWIFQIDADEELVKEDIPVLQKAVKNPEIDAIMVQIVSHLNKGKSEAMHNVERVFRNNGVIRYEGRVHNRLTGFKRPQIYPIHLIHYGYDLDDKDLAEMKHQRRISLLKMDIEHQPDNPLPYHYLSCCYQQSGQFKENLEASLKAIDLSERKNDPNPIFLWTRYNAAMAYYKLNDLKKAESMALSAIASDNRHLDSYYVLTLVCFDQSEWDNVIKHGSNYLDLNNRIRKKPDEFGIIVANTLSESWNILVLMGIAHYEKKRFKDAKESFNSAVSSASNPFTALRAIGIYYYNKNLLSESKDYLQKAFEANKEDLTIKELLNKIGGKMQSKQTISCCMIVKNEEEFLEKCLTSVKDYVDEIIIVDTGSTDNTVEIAKRFTDKVYFHPWENSFSKARNKALQYATGDWIFQIDGDEELMAGSGERLRRAIEDAENADIIYVKIFCTYANGAKKSLHNFERLFRNNNRIHYEGSVHNRVKGGTKPFYSSIELWHYGYDVDEKKAVEKFNRTTGLLKEEIEKDPNNPMHHHYLSASYLSRGMYEEAAGEAAMAVKLSDSQQNSHDLYAWSHFIASIAFYRLGQLEKAKEYALKSLNKYPGHIDSYYILTVISADEGSWDDTIKYSLAFLKLLKHVDETHKGKVILENTMNEGPAVNILLGHAYYAKKSFSEMETHYEKAYETADEKWQTWWNIGTYHMDKSGDLELAGDFLNRAVKEAPNEHNTWYMLAKLHNKCGLNKDEMGSLEKVISIGTTDSFVFDRLMSLYINGSIADKAMDLINNYSGRIKITGAELCRLAVMHLEKGRMDAAIKCYMMAIERDTGLFEAWASLGEITLNLNRLEESQLFFQKALEINKDDIEITLGLCDIGARKGDADLIVKYCDILLEKLDLPKDKTISTIDDLRSILIEIGTALKKKIYSERIADILKNLSHTDISKQDQQQ